MNALAQAPTIPELLDVVREFDRVMRVMNTNEQFSEVWYELPRSLIATWTVARDLMTRAGKG